MYEKANPCNDEHHQDRQGVDEEVERNAEIAEGDPGEISNIHQRMMNVEKKEN